VVPDNRRYIVTQSVIGAAIVNAAINVAFGWALTRGLAGLPVWRVPGVAADLVGTAFGVTFGTCIAMSIQIPRDFAKGKIAPFALPAGVASLVARFPAGTLKRGLGLGAISIPLFVPPVVAALALCGVGVVERAAFLWLKGGFSAVQGAVVTPLIVLGALSDLGARR